MNKERFYVKITCELWLSEMNGTHSNVKHNNYYFTPIKCTDIGLNRLLVNYTLIWFTKDHLCE